MDIPIFQNGDKTPMIFCLRPCPIKKKVRQLIERYGGFCFSSVLHVPAHYRENAITLIPDGEPVTGKNALRVSYIKDCVRGGQLLSRDAYTSNTCIDISLSDTEGRSSYSRTEDTHILLYVRDTAKKTTNVAGNSFWKKLESLNMLQLQGRSWQSMRDRYLKHLRGNEPSYNLDIRTIGPLPTPPAEKKRSHLKLPSSEDDRDLEDVTSVNSETMAGSFLAEIESRRNTLSPGLSPKEYRSLIGEFVKAVKREKTLDTKVILKILFKCNGKEDVARHYIMHGAPPRGFKAVSDEEDRLLLKCLLNPDDCDETPAIRLAEKLGRDVVLDRAASLIDISLTDFEYMQSIPFDFNS